jgi:hypothetical protein
MKPEQVNPAHASFALVGYWFPAHIVGKIIKSAMQAAELNVMAEYEIDHTKHDIKNIKREYAAWLKKADELEKEKA